MKFSRSTRMAALATMVISAASLTIAATIDAPASAKTYSNCKSLNADYPHGVGKPGAADSTSGTPVTDFTVDGNLYNDNTNRDRDNDGIACEKH